MAETQLIQPDQARLALELGGGMIERHLQQSLGSGIARVVAVHGRCGNARNAYRSLLALDRTFERV
jgi:hypothetical protein